MARRRTTKIRKSTGGKLNRKHCRSGFACPQGPVNCGTLRPVSHKARQLPGRLLLFAALGACASSSRGAQITPAEQPALQAPALQDQRFEVASVLVSAATGPRAKSPLSSTQSASALHSASDLARVASDGAHDIAACVVEQKASADPQSVSETLRGDLVLSLELDSGGLVLGGTTSPRGGEAGLSWVAACFLARARQWKFPGRSTPGSTVLVVPYLVED